MCLNRLAGKKLNSRQQGLLSALEFLVRLLLLSIPLYVIIGLGINLIALQVAVAGQSGYILQAMGFHVVQNGPFITSSIPGGGPFHFLINEDCTGWKSMLFLFALIFAVPGIAMRKRLIGLAIGLPVIWLGNLARVVGVVLAERAYGAENALLLHDYLWQMGMVALVLIIWMAWMRFARARARPKNAGMAKKPKGKATAGQKPGSRQKNKSMGMPKTRSGSVSR